MREDSNLFRQMMSLFCCLCLKLPLPKIYHVLLTNIQMSSYYLQLMLLLSM